MQEGEIVDWNTQGIYVHIGERRFEYNEKASCCFFVPGYGVGFGRPGNCC